MGRSATVSPVVVLVFLFCRCLRVLLVFLGLITPSLAASFSFLRHREPRCCDSWLFPIFYCLTVLPSTVLPSYRLTVCALCVLLLALPVLPQWLFGTPYSCLRWSVITCAFTSLFGLGEVD